MGPNTDLTTTYQGKKLVMLENQLLDSNRYPIRIPNSEIASMNSFPHLVNILSKKARSPSETARLPKGEISAPIIHKADKEFREAMLQYELDLNAKIGEDSKKTREWERRYPLGCNPVSNTGCGELGNKMGVYGYVTPTLMGIIMKLFNNSSAKKIIENEGIMKNSVYRKKWLNTTDTLEEARIGKLRAEMIAACRPLIIDLIDLKSKGQICQIRLSQLGQIYRVFVANFPDEKLKVENQDVGQFLESFKKK